VKAKTWDQSSPHTTGTSTTAPDSLLLTFSQPCPLGGTPGLALSVSTLLAIVKNDVLFF
jgi:hypothetical protein